MLNIVVASAGVTEQGAIDTLTPEHFDKVFDVNAKAPVHTMQTSLPLMRDGGGLLGVGAEFLDDGIELDGRRRYSSGLRLTI